MSYTGASLGHKHYLLNPQHVYGIAHHPSAINIHTHTASRRVSPIITAMIVIFLAAFQQQQHSSSHLISQKTRMSGSSHTHTNAQNHTKDTHHVYKCSCTQITHAQTHTLMHTCSEQSSVVPSCAPTPSLST